MAGNTNNKVEMLLIIQDKKNALLQADIDLIKKLAKPDAPEAIINTQLAANTIEEDLLKAKYSQIKNGSTFNFPSSSEIAALAAAIEELETKVEQAAAVDAVISASSEVIATVGANTM